MTSAEKSSQWMLLALLALCGSSCGAPEGSQSPAVSQPAKPALADVPAAAPPAPYRNRDLPLQPERVGNVTIDPRPRCGPAYDEQKEAARAKWIEAPAMQSGLTTLSHAIERFPNYSLGIALDNDQHRVIAVFHTDFHGYASVRDWVVSRHSPLEVVLQPSCYPREVLDEAQRVLLEGSWHPKARSGGMGFYPDASISGFHVTVETEEVAEALRKRLGKLVQVTVGKAGRT